MAAKDQQDFCKGVKLLYPSLFQGDVLDLGSLDINGNNRYLFDGNNYKYLGVDLGEGPNVDVIGKAHELKFIDNFFDVIISTEMLEHDPYWDSSVKNALRMLKPGGLMILTMGGVGRKEHGTTKSIPEDSPFTTKMEEEWQTYYKNLTMEDILSVLLRNEFKVYSLTMNNEHCDLYFYGIKK